MVQCTIERAGFRTRLSLSFVFFFAYKIRAQKSERGEGKHGDEATIELYARAFPHRQCT